MSDEKVPREFWLLLDTNSNMGIIREPGEKWGDDVNGEPSSRFVHVIEKLPDSRLITREMLREAMDKASHYSSDEVDQDLLEKLLFGATDEVSDHTRESESAAEFLQRLGMDGDLWAKEFIAICSDPKDLDTMRGWFANAIMAGYDKGRNETRAGLEHTITEQQDFIDATFGRKSLPDAEGKQDLTDERGKASTDDGCLEALKTASFALDKLAPWSRMKPRTLIEVEELAKTALETVNEQILNWTKARSLIAESESAKSPYTDEELAAWEDGVDDGYEVAKDSEILYLKIECTNAKCALQSATERIADLEHQLSLPKVPQSQEMRDMTKRVIELEAELTKEREYSSEAHARFEEQNDRITSLLQANAELKAENARLFTYSGKLAQAHLDLEAEIDRLQQYNDAAILAKERDRLAHEVRYLRAYGNKDCTAMADAAMKNDELDTEARGTRTP